MACHGLHILALYTASILVYLLLTYASVSLGKKKTDLSVGTPLVVTNLAMEKHQAENR